MAIHKLKIFSCRGSRYLAEKIAANFGVNLGNSQVLEFSDGEFQPAYDESIRGCTVFIVQSTFPPADNLMELLLMIDAAHRASAHRVIAVMPYFGWARQDRKDRPRVSIGAKLVANLLRAAGVDRINKSALSEVIVTDTIPLKQSEDLSKFTVLSVADLFADVIERVHDYKEISSKFIF